MKRRTGACQPYIGHEPAIPNRIVAELRRVIQEAGY
jgi:hypothetical protein